MAYIPDTALRDMINRIPDARERKKLSDIIARRITKQIKCMSEHCKGVVVGYIYSDGIVQEESNKEGSGAEAFRWRTDGVLGVKCACGNYSIMGEDEKDTLEYPLQKDHLEKMAEKYRVKPPDYPVIDGRQEVDGFVIEDIT